MASPRFKKGNKLRVGISPWNKGKKTGFAPWLGKHRSEETKRKISLAEKGRMPWILGKKHTIETKRKISKNRKGLMIGKNHPNWTGGKPRCVGCGKQLVSYCAKRCLNCVGKLRLGSKNWNWKGGITTQDRLERIKFRNTIQKLVFERDNYTCTMCGLRGIDLTVDHIQSWTDYVELRFSMENCRTLCASCHYLITFGKPMPKNIKGWGHNLLERARIIK